ncbi:MAG: hypothetical protein QOE09_66 [Ilumatobacteraceae bacterium]|jgi:hypothetical protein
MQNKRLFALTAVGLAAAIAVPTIAFGNARTAPGASLDFLNGALTPDVARLAGANEVPPGDPDGTGGFAVTFDILNPADLVAGAEACWDLSYANITGTPVAAHIHRGAAGVNGPVVVPAGGVSFTNLGPTSSTGCTNIAPALATEIMTTPANFYANVHTTDFPGGSIRGQLSAGPPPAGMAHLLAAPLRAYDSRDNAGPKIGVNESRTISLTAGKDGAGATQIAVPPGASAAIVTLTVTETGTGVGGPGGFMKIYAAGAAVVPATSSINWFGADQNLAVNLQVPVDSAGRVTVFAGANATHFVIDVVGYLF